MATVAGATQRRSDFHVRMALVFSAIAFVGFVPTYWSRLAAGTFTGQPVMHLHGALFFGWSLLYLAQTIRVSAGRVAAHRAWGLLGLALIGAMAVTVPLAVINSIWQATRFGPEEVDLARRFSAVSLTSLILILGLFALAMANVQRPDVHKRLMLLMQIPFLQAASGRLVAVALTPAGTPAFYPPPGAFVSVPSGLAMCLLVVVAMVHDRRTIGHVHPVYKVGLPLLVAQILLVVPLSMTGWWLAFATWLQGLVRLG
ncbi:hypothetical protein [Polymorphobacter sp.]|uniref:hypothetical protein n=1 Tax=Polymorphobacter sp. TaxID=1909290 RepID=UPI003F6ECEB5